MIGLWAVFLALQLAGALVPDKAVAQGVVKSLDAGLELTEPAEKLLGGPYDRTTDCVAIGTGMAWESVSLWDRVAKVPRIGNCRGMEERLRALSEDHLEGIDDRAYYLRYWGGYTSVFRPALALWGPAGMAAVAGAALAVGLLAMWFALGRALTPLGAAAFTLPVLISTDALVLPAGSQVHALALGIAFLGLAAVSLSVRRGLGAMTLAAVGSGAVLNYFDLINVAPLAWVLTGATGGLVALYQQGRTGRVAKATALASAGWMAGYAGAFVERWITAALAAGPRAVWKQVVELVGIRSGLSGQEAYSTVKRDLGLPTWLNLRAFFDLPLGWLVAVATLVAVVAFLALAVRRRGLAALGRYGAFVWVGLLAPFWFEVMSNHSQIHAWFTFRAVAGSLAAALAGAVVLWLWSRVPADAVGSVQETG
ncbi:MAG: hypothetical protein LBJ02_02910 [Bifidobacteriaceae bacterium]|jgi:hypothetical protein|nr:hypothetical protein [Bifidobacteriaceae bacterium]